MQRRLLEIADELRALASTGMHYTESVWDRDRYESLMRLAVRLASVTEAESAEEIERLYRTSDEGYATPKLDVRVAVFRELELLLVREAADGCWAMPGGYVDIGDSPSEAAIREVAEEAGVEVRMRRLVGVFDNRVRPDAPPHLFHIHKLVFLGELANAEVRLRPNHEVLEVAFHPLDALPELSLGRTSPFHIEQARRILRDPHQPPYFD